MNTFNENFKKFIKFDLDKITFLESPNHFYLKIMELLPKSNDVYISTLFIGNDSKSEKIFELIKERKNKNYTTLLIIDRNRAMRDERITKKIRELDIEDLFVLFDTKTCSFLPSKLQELISVLHSKIYLFDTQIILTGANLDHAYFTNRMDRYLLIDNKKLSEYLKQKYFSKFVYNNTNSNIELFNTTVSDTKTRLITFQQQDEIEILQNIFKSSFDEIIFSTAYLNLTPEHISILKEKKLKIITSSTESNTFRYDEQFEKFVVENYIINKINAMKELKNLDLYEYNNQDATFHCKGLWCFTEKIAYFIVGSTNFNARSIHRDIETNFLIVTTDVNLIKDFKNEIADIMKHASQISLKSLEEKHLSLVSRYGQIFTKGYL